MPAQTRRSYENDNVTTIKISSANLLILSKVLADIHSRYKIFSASSIMVNSQSKLYFAFLNVKNEEIAERLQEITPYRSTSP